MGTRVVIKCTSQRIPGDPKLREHAISNTFCQKVWHRDFGQAQDRLESLGRFDCDGVQCFFLVDNGPPESQEVSTSMYDWDGLSFTEIPVSPVVKAHLQQYPFNPANKKRGYSDEEYREEFGEGGFRDMMNEGIQQKRKYSLKLTATEEAFLQTYPGLVGYM